MSSSASPVIHAFPTDIAIGTALAQFLLTAQQEALKDRDTFTIAISGGGMPTLLALGLVDLEGVEWDKWHVWFADERLVPLNHEDSNYLLASTELLSKIPIPDSNVHKIDETLLHDPEACAQDYEERFRTSIRTEAGSHPVLDVVLLGMGPDGHTCSLFPSHSLLDERSRTIAAIVDSPKPPSRRITLTLPAIAQARYIAYEAFATSGETVKEVLERPQDRRLPAARVVAANGSPVTWFTSDEIANGLE